MRLVEFRIFVPFNMEQTMIASRYGLARRTAEETGNGEGVQVVENSSFIEDGVTGNYVHRIYHVKSQAPPAFRWALPSRFSHIHEHNRNAFPHYDNWFEIPEMGNDMILKNETRHFEYHHGDTVPENLLRLSSEELKIRKVWYLDLYNGPDPSKKEFDLHGFSCPEAGFPGFKAPKNRKNDGEIPEWVKYYNGPLTLIVKVIKFKFKWFGIQTAIEKYVTHNVFYHLFLDSHRAQVKWMPEWYKMSVADVAAYEDQIKRRLDKAEFDLNDDSDGDPIKNEGEKSSVKTAHVSPVAEKSI